MAVCGICIACNPLGHPVNQLLKPNTVSDKVGPDYYLIVGEKMKGNNMYTLLIHISCV